jgi:sugar lactone lactonase YvrE
VPQRSAVGTAGAGLEPDGALTTYADLSAHASFPLNDMVVDVSGRAYVGSADSDNLPDSAPSELIVVHPDGRSDVADTGLRFPNGTVVTPDGATLIVAESQGCRLLAYTIDGGGSLDGRRVWADTPGMFPDGICLDEDGCVWFADAGGQACVRVAEGGAVRDRIETGQGTFACALGGADGRTLFVATSTFPDGESFDPRPGRILAFAVDVAGTGSP